MIDHRRSVKKTFKFFYFLQDSLGLSEQEIQEFKASKLDMESRRKELRNKLRDQFQKLCINHLANGCRVCDVCT